jgi:hypothetical protein
MPPITFDHQLVWNFLDRFGMYTPVTSVHRKWFPRGRKGKCFANARAYVRGMKGQMTYIEGLAGYRKHDGVLHGWNRLKADPVKHRFCDYFLDLTWPTSWQRFLPWYCGVEFDMDFAEMVMALQCKEAGWYNGRKPPADHGGFSVLTYEPLLLGRVAPYTF